MKRFKILIVLSFINLPFFLWSQGPQVLKGKILNEQDEPVPFANIMLVKKELPGHPINFGMSDDRGGFELEYTGNESLSELLLIGSALGHRGDTVLLKAYKNTNLQLRLVTEAFQLEEVQVTTYRLPFTTDGDTTEFNADQYTDGTERAVEELVKKMPGVKVKADGDIYYRGKRVEKVLLEDDELFGNNYALGTKSLNAEVVGKIQFVDKYQDNHLLKNVKQSDQLVMNIKIRDERKKLLFGNVEAGYGNRGRYKGALNLYSLLKNHKLVLLGNAGNLGESYFSYFSYLTRGFQLDAPYEYQRPASFISTAEAFIPNQLQEQEVRANSSRMLAANLVFNPSEKVKIKSYLLRFGEQVSSRSFSGFEDLSEVRNWQYEESNFFQQKAGGWKADTELTWQIHKDMNMKYNSELQWVDLQNQLNSNLVQAEKISYYPQDLKNRQVNSKQALNVVKKLDAKRVLSLDATWYKDNKLQDYRFPSPEFGPEVGLFQQTGHQVNDLDFRSTLLGKTSQFKYNFSMGAQRQQDDIYAQIDVLQAGRQQMQLKRTQVFTDVSVFWPIGPISLNLEYRLGQLKDQQTGAGLLSRNKDQWYQEYQFGLQYKKDRSWYLFTNYGKNNKLPGVRQLMPFYVFSSYRNFRKGNPDLHSFTGQQVSAGLKYMNTFRMLEFHLMGIYQLNNKSVGDSYQFSNLMNYRQTRQLGGDKNLSVNGSVDKLIPFLSSNIALNANYYYWQYPVAPNELGNTYAEVKTLGMGLNYTSAFRGPVNAGVEGEWIRSFFTTDYSGIPEESINDRYSLRYFLIIKPVKHVLIRADTRQVLNVVDQQLFFTNCRIQYNSDKRWTAELSIQNLLDYQTYYSAQFSQDAFVTNALQLNPRIILLSSRWQF